MRALERARGRRRGLGTQGSGVFFRSREEKIVEPLLIRALEQKDWPAASAIFEQGIATGDATFEETPPSWQSWDEHHLPVRLVAEENGVVAGWAALAPVSTRPCYAGVAEASVYVAENARGQGIGRALLARLIEDSEAAGFWTIQAGIFPENVASLELHRACGFRDVGVRERLGQLRGVWRDVVLLERRTTRW